LAFYGWVRGLEVRHRGGSGGASGFGVAMEGAVCWFGADDWQTNGSPGLELGQALWQAWLGAGGPWPTEFVLTMAASDLHQPLQECYKKSGSRCQQWWAVKEVRARPGWR
jgi:hypothetical protein